MYRYLALFHATGFVEPREHKGSPVKVTNHLELFTILQSLIHKPTLYLRELQEKLFQTTGTWVDHLPYYRGQEFTRKRVQYIALKQINIKKWNI